MAQLATAVQQAGIPAPVLSALASLVEGSLPLEEWVARVRTRQPEPPTRRGRFMEWLRRLFRRFTTPRPALPPPRGGGGDG